MATLIPKTYNELLESITNLDEGEIPKGLEEKLKNEEVFCQHAAWNFCGYVWYSNDNFYDEVMIHHKIVEVMMNPNLKELIREVNDKYGWD